LGAGGGSQKSEGNGETGVATTKTHRISQKKKKRKKEKGTREREDGCGFGETLRTRRQKTNQHVKICLRKRKGEAKTKWEKSGTSRKTCKTRSKEKGGGTKGAIKQAIPENDQRGILLYVEMDREGKTCFGMFVKQGGVKRSITGNGKRRARGCMRPIGDSRRPKEQGDLQRLREGGRTRKNVAKPSRGVFPVWKESQEKEEKK